MKTLSTERTVTPLRQRMLDDMAMRGMESRTQHDDVRDADAATRTGVHLKPRRSAISMPETQLGRAVPAG